VRQQEVHSLYLVRACSIIKSLSFHGRVRLKGSVRTATKRAGGTVRNHGGSPGKRLGLKKFSGTSFRLAYHTSSNAEYLSRSVCHPRQYHSAPAGNAIPPRAECIQPPFPSIKSSHFTYLFLGQNGSRPYYLRHHSWFRAILQAKVATKRPEVYRCGPPSRREASKR
jgi:hypothetical protein